MTSTTVGHDRQPMMLLLAGSDLTIRLCVGPTAVATAVREAQNTGVTAGELAWSPLRPMHAAFSAARAGKRRAISWQLAGVEFHGHVVPVHDDAGNVAGVAVVGVNALVAADRSELHELRLAMRQAQEATSSAYYVLDLANDRVTLTPAFARIWGFPEETRELPFSALLERIYEPDRSAFFAARESALNSKGALELEFRIVRAPGDIRHLRVLGAFFTDARGNAARSVGTVVDITDHVRTQEAVSFLSKRDSLTGLLNRHVLIQLLDERANDSEDHALLLLDIDRFGAINDIAGHAVGDRLLRGVGDRLSALERHGHAVARLGGDEFGALLFNTRSDDAAALAGEIAQRLSAPYRIDDSEYVLRITAGLACTPADGSGMTLLQNANMAMLGAKASSPGTIGRFDVEVEQRLSARSRMERDLSAALDRGQFTMYYQPVIDAKTGDVCATEALLRWRHPELGLLTPDVFLSIAEESELVVTIGRWVMDRACRDAVRMRSSFDKPLRLNVNVSPRQVQSSELVRDVDRALDDSGLSADELQLEVTEQMLIADIDSAATTLFDLRARGVSIAIDDFGTGYNTLSYLKSYPIDCIKIDRAFVRDSESDDYSRAICRTVKTLAESLQLHLIGEGVETPAQAAFLQHLGCNELQGFHFGHPAPIDEFISAYATA